MVATPSPPLAERKKLVKEQLEWMESRTNSHHARGTFVIPFSMHNIDDVLDDLDLNIGKGKKFGQWLSPVNPSAYRGSVKKLKDRVNT